MTTRCSCSLKNVATYNFTSFHLSSFLRSDLFQDWRSWRYSRLQEQWWCKIQPLLEEEESCLLLRFFCFRDPFLGEGNWLRSRNNNQAESVWQPAVGENSNHLHSPWSCILYCVINSKEIAWFLWPALLLVKSFKIPLCSLARYLSESHLLMISPVCRDHVWGCLNAGVYCFSRCLIWHGASK